MTITDISCDPPITAREPTVSAAGFGHESCGFNRNPPCVDLPKSDDLFAHAVKHWASERTHSTNYHIDRHGIHQNSELINSLAQLIVSPLVMRRKFIGDIVD